MTDPIAATTTQTILGANGVIARELSRCLCESAQRIRQVSRNPRRINEGAASHRSGSARHRAPLQKRYPGGAERDGQIVGQGTPDPQFLRQVENSFRAHKLRDLDRRNIQ